MIQCLVLFIVEKMTYSINLDGCDSSPYQEWRRNYFVSKTKKSFRAAEQHQHLKLVVKLLIVMIMSILYQLTNMMAMKNGLKLSNER